MIGVPAGGSNIVTSGRKISGFGSTNQDYTDIDYALIVRSDTTVGIHVAFTGTP